MFRKPRETGYRPRCTGKIRYRDQREAVRALHQAKTRRKRELHDQGISRRNESRVYECSDCRGLHLTSVPFNADLAYS